MLETNDNQLLLVGTFSVDSTIVTKVDLADGDVIWQNRTEGDTYLSYEYVRPSDEEDRTIGTDWINGGLRVVPNEKMDIIQTPDGNYVLVGIDYFSVGYVVQKIDSLGNNIWIDAFHGRHKSRMMLFQLPLP